MSPSDEMLAVAKTGTPRGLGGHLKLHSYSGEFKHLLKLKEVLLAPESRPMEGKMMAIAGFQSGAWGASVLFKGYESPEKAKALTGLVLYLPRDKVSPLSEGEYYIHDLVGMALVFQGNVEGKVEAVLDGGADPLLEVRRVQKEGSFLVPFRSVFVGRVDLTERTIELVAGWLLE
jgi:16S rRNA processing protein RimM